MARLAVLGLGAMGGRVARRLLDLGHEVVVWNRTAARAEPLTRAGASAAPSPGEAAAGCEAVLLMVSDAGALQQVTEGPDGVLAGMAPGSTLIQMSTVGPAAISRLSSALPEGIGLLDAPVLGSISEASEGALLVFAAGPPTLVERWTPMLSDLGEVLPVGPLDAGQSAKLVANSTLFGSLGVLGEALALARALGLADDVTFRVLAGTPVAAQAERRRPFLEREEFPLRFSLALARKDADLVVERGEAAGADLRLARAARSYLVEAEEGGEGDLDYSAVLSRIIRGAGPAAD